MPFGTDGSGFLSNSITQLFEMVATPAGVSKVAAFIVGWFLTRAATAILGEYIKRFWFRRVWRDEVIRCRLQLEQLQISIAAERAEYQWTIACAERLITENDRLILRVIQLEAVEAARIAQAEPTCAT